MMGIHQQGPSHSNARASMHVCVGVLVCVFLLKLKSQIDKSEKNAKMCVAVCRGCV